MTTAIIRDHPGLAWNLATPHMREGSTRAEWASGTLPFNQPVQVIDFVLQNARVVSRRLELDRLARGLKT